MSDSAIPTKEQFEAYVRVRDSGKTNMYAIDTVCKLAHANLTRQHCMYIMKHFMELAEEYGVEV